MTLNDWKNRLMGAFARRAGGNETRRPDGGTSCYRPMQRRTPQEQQEPAGPAPVQYVHTGFTGMNPPSAYGGGFMQDSGRQDAYGTAWNPAPFGQAQNPAQPPLAPYAQADAFGRNSMPAQGTYFPNPQPPEERTAARPERGWFAPQEDRQRQGNISYMPGYAPDAGSAYTHVEHIMTMTGLKSCYEAIACMKNGETLIVMMDAIANEGESMRCQDMLAGAAFTLGCTVRMLQGGRLVLIAPEGVMVLPEQAQGRPEMPPVYAPAPAPQAPERAQNRRERRSGAHPEEWNAARNGQMNNYNPYTGTMPAAAGAYGSFGGYGY